MQAFAAGGGGAALRGPCCVCTLNDGWRPKKTKGSFTRAPFPRRTRGVADVAGRLLETTAALDAQWSGRLSC